MKDSDNKPLVTTIKEHCRICFTCVRECPAKAIRIADGQAEVIPQRCIGCGNCVRVCSQSAKKIQDSKPQVKKLLSENVKVAAIVAPSFPAEFTDYNYKAVVAMLRKLGFDLVNEVAFGADLVAEAYKRLLSECDPKCRFIATTCPSIVAYVERYHPELVGNLAPIVSPMVAMARALKKFHGEDLKIVFIGPCIAKKGEASSVNLPDEVEAVLTFAELREMLDEAGITSGEVEESEFDGPHAGTGAIFPIGRGLFQAAEINDDLVQGEVIAVEGGSSYIDAFKEFDSGDLQVKLLEVLACSGCIMGPGMSNSNPRFNRQAKISEFARSRRENFDIEQWKAHVENLKGLDLTRKFEKYDQRIQIPVDTVLDDVLHRMGKFTKEDELNCGACGYDTCREHAVAILKGLAESEMCLPFTIERLHKTIKQLASSNTQLASTQEALMQSEKLASMGQLAAGIAHEVNNPLGVVLMYAHLLLDELKDNQQVSDDLQIITEQADRCKKIVSGLLNFARKNKVMLHPTDIYELICRTVQTYRSDPRIHIKIENNLDDNIVYIDSDQIGQVLTNLVSNAISAMNEKGDLSIELNDKDDRIEIKVSDTGIGIREDILSKIFEPFFTTKEMGLGTGLGLAVTYGIVKMHNGDILVESNADAEKGPTGTTFTVVLPKKKDETKKDITIEETLN